MVYSLVVSHLLYCSEIYLRTLKVRKKAQRLPNAAAQLALRKTRYANCEEMMEELKWLNMNNEYQSQLILSLRQSRTTMAAAYTLKWIDGESRASIRTKLIKLSWKAKNNHGKFSFLQAATTAWNKLEVGKELAKAELTPKELKDHLFTKIKSLFGNKNL